MAVSGPLPVDANCTSVALLWFLRGEERVVLAYESQHIVTAPGVRAGSDWLTVCP